MDELIDPSPFVGLAGQVTLEVAEAADAFVRNEVVVRAVHDLSPVGGRYGAMVIVPRALLDDATGYRSIVEAELARRLMPWLDPDRPAWPTFVPFPRLAGLERRLRALRRR